MLHSSAIWSYGIRQPPLSSVSVPTSLDPPTITTFPVASPTSPSLAPIKIEEWVLKLRSKKPLRDILSCWIWDFLFLLNGQWQWRCVCIIEVSWCPASYSRLSHPAIHEGNSFGAALSAKIISCCGWHPEFFKISFLFFFIFSPIFF